MIMEIFDDINCRCFFSFKIDINCLVNNFLCKLILKILKLIFVYLEINFLWKFILKGLIMKFLDVLCAILVIVGGLNWGIIGVSNFNLVDSLLSGIHLVRVAYILVGLSAIYQIFSIKGIQKRWYS